MTENPMRAMDSEARHLLEQLLRTRQSVREASEAERREALLETLRAGVPANDPAAANTRLDAVRQLVLLQARDAQELGERMAAETERLASEVQRLEAENSRLRSTKPDTLLRILREGLRQIADDETPDPPPAGLPAEDGAMLLLLEELLTFAIRVQTGVEVFLLDARSGLDSSKSMVRPFARATRSRLKDCLAGKAGALDALRQALNRDSRFLIQINGAYLGAISGGSKSLLEELNPGPLAETARSKFRGIDHEKAWEIYETRHSDIASLSRAEMWERFFQEPFRQALDTQKESDRTP